MNETNKMKNQSALVTTIISLDGHFADLERLGQKIGDSEMQSEFESEQAQRLMTRFAEVGQAVSSEIVDLAQQLGEARARAEAVAAMVSARAEQLKVRADEQQKKMDQFRLLGEKVKNITSFLNELKKPEGQDLSPEDRAQWSKHLSDVEQQIRPLIEEALILKKDAQSSKMKVLEQNADALSQSMQMVSKKLSSHASLLH